MAKPRSTGWEDGFRSSVRRSMPYWTVSKSPGGKVLLKARVPGEPSESVVLPMPWTAADQNRALLLISQMRRLVDAGEQNLRGALEVARAGSDTMKVKADWPAIAESLRVLRMTGIHQVSARTWQRNYGRYLKVALAELNGPRPPHDGRQLLQRVLTHWDDRPASRAVCCLAIRALLDHAVEQHRAPVCWRLGTAALRELRGRPAERREKATLADVELLRLVDAGAARSEAWGNALRLLTLYGLRPIELQHLRAREVNGELRMWCAYRKTCGGSKTEPRWLLPAPLVGEDGQPITWQLPSLLGAGLLPLPTQITQSSASDLSTLLRQFLRSLPEWQSLDEAARARGEWLRPYVFRDSFSLRCHQRKVEVGAIARAMGHSLSVHSSNYRWASDEGVAEEFATAFAVEGGKPRPLNQGNP